MTKKCNVIVVANQKGGTGKTTTTENVGQSRQKSINGRL